MDEPIYLTEDECDELRKILIALPDLCNQLDDLIANAGRSPSLAPTHKAPDSTPPVNVPALSAREHLRTDLTDWITTTINQRHVEERPPADTITALCDWLYSHDHDIALTRPPSFTATPWRTALYCIKEHRDHIRNLLTGPTERDISTGITSDEALRKSADQLYTASQLETIAKNLGARGRGLTRKRIHYLTSEGRLQPIPTINDNTYYRLSDALNAHQPRRTPQTGHIHAAGLGT